MFGYDVDAFKRKWFEKGYDQARKDLEQGSDPLHQQVNALKQALVVLGYENQKLQQAVAKSIEERLNDYAQN
jgi:Holliday junction resolvasome RuvABC DNA-binding subunit